MDSGRLHSIFYEYQQTFKYKKNRGDSLRGDSFVEIAFSGVFCKQKQGMTTVTKKTGKHPVSIITFRMTKPLTLISCRHVYGYIVGVSFIHSKENP